VSQVWDVVDLKLTFRRAVSHSNMLLWDELLQVANSLTLSHEKDALIWKYNSNGQYSVQTLYAIVNCRVFSPFMLLLFGSWMCPPRVHIFLWLLANNRLLTRDNLCKRKEISDKTCLFCTEPESITHMFFECCVANLIWQELSCLFDKPIGADFESVVRW
jgi:hypothetical protein